MGRDEVSISPPLQIFRMLSFRLDAAQTANTAINTTNDFNLIITSLHLLKKYLILIAPNATGRKLLKTFENASDRNRLSNSHILRRLESRDRTGFHTENTLVRHDLLGDCMNPAFRS